MTTAHPAPRTQANAHSVDRRRFRLLRPRLRPLKPPPPAPPRVTGPFDLGAIAARVAEAGPAASHALLVHVADHARARGVGSTVAGVLADPTAPDVVRTRALGVVSARLAGSDRADGRAESRADADSVASAPPVAA